MRVYVHHVLVTYVTEIPKVFDGICVDIREVFNEVDYSIIESSVETIRTMRMTIPDMPDGDDIDDWLNQHVDPLCGINGPPWDE